MNLHGHIAVALIAGGLLLSGCDSSQPEASASGNGAADAAEQIDMKQKDKTYPVVKSDEQWRKELTAEQYKVLRQKGTERPFTGEYSDNKEAGQYVCAGCGQPLYSSETKFDSGTGWPSYWAPITEQAVEMKADGSLFWSRTELVCSNCGGHLGHVFDDGPPPTGMRHCINSAALKFEPAEGNDQTPVANDK